MLQLNVLSAAMQKDDLVVTAKSYAPVTWDIKIIVEARDIPAVCRMAVSRAALAFLARSLLSRVRMCWHRRAVASEVTKSA